jgi:hypothetical protein
MVHPIVLGTEKWSLRGRRDQLPPKLLESKTFVTGVVSLAYQPVHT